MGLEPTTSAVTGRHSNQLNHRANVSVSDSYIYYHTFNVLARGFLKKILEKVLVAKKGLICKGDLCLSTIRNYITLKPSLNHSFHIVRLSTIRNYITLKLSKSTVAISESLSTIRNYITLKHRYGGYCQLICLSTIRNYITLKHL